MRVFIIIQIFIIIQTEIRLSSKCDFHIADRICFAGVDISEHLVCVAKEHASWHKHFARNKFDSAKRTFAATAAYVDSDACSFKRTQNGFIAFCVDNLVAYFEFENLCSAQFLRKTRFVLNVLACAEHLAADIAWTDIERVQSLNTEVCHHLRTAKVECCFAQIFDDLAYAVCIDKTASVAAFCVLVRQNQGVGEVGVGFCRFSLCR